MERNWIMTCTKFKMIRELLAKNEKTIDMCKQILTALQACDDEIVARFSDWEWREDFAELSSELHDEIYWMDAEESYAACEEIVNDRLKEMYNLCDDASVWLAV